MILFIKVLIILRGIIPPAEDPCISLVKDAYRIINTQSVEKDRIRYFEYLFRTQSPGTDNWIQTNVEVYSGLGKSLFISPDIRIFQDQTLKVSVIPHQKIIYISSYKPDPARNEMLKNLSVFQDSLFLFSKVAFCEKVSFHKIPGHKKITLQVDETGKKRFMVRTAVFYIEEKTKRLREISIEYTEGFKFKRMEVVFNRMDSDTKTTVLNSSAYNYIYTKQGQFLPAYQGYKLIDTRKNR